MGTSITELEKRHESLSRAARRNKHWEGAAESAAEELVEAKQDRIEELRAGLPTDDGNLSSAEAAAIEELEGNSEQRRVAELRAEVEQHREEIAELEEQ